MPTPVTKIFSGDEMLDRVQDQLVPALNALTRIAIMDGRSVEGVEVSATPVNVEHKLGRNYRGWIVTDIDAGVVVFTDPTNPDPTKFVRLQATAAAVVNLWVY